MADSRAEPNARTAAEAMSFDLLEALPISVFVVDAAGSPVYLNPAARALLGRDVEPGASLGELPRMFSAYEAGTGRPYPAERSTLARALRGEVATTTDLEIRRPDGTFRLHVTAVPLFGDDGRVTGAMATFQDITERTRAETELRLTQELALAISGAGTLDDALGIAVRRVVETTGWSYGQAWLPDPTGSYLECAETCCGPEEFDDFHAASREVTLALGAGLPGSVWATKRPRWVEDVQAESNFSLGSAARWAGLQAALAVPVMAGDECVAVLEFFLQEPRPEDRNSMELIGGVAAQLGSFVRRRRAEDALRRSERELRELDRIKNTFLQGVSHELRTPLGAMRGISLLLARDLDRATPKLSTDQQRTLLQRLSNTARTMNHLLDDLLDLDRLVLGILEPHRSRVDVAEVIRRVVTDSEAAEERTIEIDAGSRVVLALDEPKLERIVENLVSNAAKYSPPDSPIWVRCRPDGAGVLIAVEDAGTGVPEAERERIFEAFNRGGADEAAAPGLGIGLSLVRAFAEMHGGRAWVEDRAGGGASFRVLLPGAGADGMAGAESDSA